jgi:hypothetical protein
MATENISCNRKSNRHIHLVATYHVRKMLVHNTILNRYEQMELIIQTIVHIVL